MRQYFGNFILRLSEKILGRPACFIYTRPHGKYPHYRADGYRGNSPLLKQKIEKEYKQHIIVCNKYPYKGFLQHFLIVPKREVETLLELNSEEQTELIHIIGEYEAQGYMILSQQFGVSHGSSIAHKHVHVLK